jgi:hypothetical protein
MMTATELLDTMNRIDPAGAWELSPSSFSGQQKLNTHGRTVAYVLQGRGGLTARQHYVQPPLNVKGIGMDIAMMDAARAIARHARR